MLLTLNGSANPITNISPKLRLAIKRFVTLSRFIKRKIVMRTRIFPEMNILMMILCLLLAKKLTHTLTDSSGAGGTKDVHPFSFQFLSFFMQFLGNFWPNNRFTPPSQVA